jgi:osmotically-inducible protein OsmY
MRRRDEELEADQWLGDDELQQRIADHIETDQSFWSGGVKRMARPVIEVDAVGGIVTLTGVVRTRSDRRRADLIARALGARSVDNRLHIQGEDDATAS